MTRGMGFGAPGQPQELWWATLTRRTAASATPAVVYTRLPCSVGHVSREATFQVPYENATHVLTTHLSRPLIQAGDALTHLIGPDGVDFVRPGKPWAVIGRRHFHGEPDTGHQTAFLREEV